jgi:branched-chain amino acid transport system substrate-binding protein
MNSNPLGKEDMAMNRIILGLFSVLLVVALTSVGFAAPAATQKAPVKIGHIRSLTGPVAITNAQMVKGFELAMDLAHYEIAGRKVEIIIEDDGAKAEVSVDKARKLIEKDKVDMIVGPTMGGLQMAVSTYMNKVGIPNIHTNPSPYGVIAQKHQWTIQVGGASAQIPSCGGRYVVEKLGVKRAIVIGEDTAPGRDYVGGFLSGFKSAGGTVIQEQWTPLGCSDYAPYFAAARPADACVVWTSGGDSIKFLNQYHEFGMGEKMRLLPAYQGAIIESFILAQLQPKAAEALIGLVSSIQYSPFFDNDVNKKFVEAYQKKYNRPPDNAESHAYCAALVIKAALEATGGDTTPQKLLAAMLATAITTTEGPVRFDKEKKSAIKNVAISKLEKVGKEFMFSAPIFVYMDVPPEGFK